MSKDTDKRFDIVYSAQVTYTLTFNDLKFLNDGQPIQVTIDKKCGLILKSPKPRENK